MVVLSVFFWLVPLKTPCFTFCLALAFSAQSFAFLLLFCNLKYFIASSSFGCDAFWFFGSLVLLSLSGEALLNLLSMTNC